MDPNFGSGSAMLGGGNDALAQAMARRQTGQAGAGQQVSPAAPTYDPATQQPPMQGGSAPMPMGGQPMPPGAPQEQPMAAGAPMGTDAGIPFGSPEAKLILGSLGNYLKSITKFHGVG